MQRNPQEHWITGNFLAGADSSDQEVAIAVKSVRIVQKVSVDAVRWQENKYALERKNS